MFKTRYLAPALIIALAAALAVYSLSPADAGEADDNLGDRPDMESKFAAQINAAVKKGCEWLKSQQQPDGSWLGSGPQETHYKTGTTAFTLFALLKGGVDRKEDCIKKGFIYLRQNLHPFKKDSRGIDEQIYNVSTAVLALEAYYAMPTQEQKKEEGELGGTIAVDPAERAKKNFKKAPRQDKAWMKQLIDYLVQKQATMQQGGVWRYPGMAKDKCLVDASNTQYAMLALNAGRRLGFSIPAKTWVQTIIYFLKYQDADGPEVPSFKVPGADFSIDDLNKLAKEFRKDVQKQAREARKKGEEMGEISTGVDPYGRIGSEEHKMKARGWSYIPTGFGEVNKFPSFTVTCGSMTTSGVAALVICKAALEDKGGYRKYQEKCDQAIRDGAAWLAHNFDVTTNPKRPGGQYHYYYLYGLERAGVLSMAAEFGKNDWYDEGAKFLLGRQTANGSWPADSNSHASALVDTDFAILFLCRATTPIIPHEIFTGGDLLGKGKKEEK